MDLSEEKRQVTGEGNRPTSVCTNLIHLIEKEEEDNKKMVIKLTRLYDPICQSQRCMKCNSSYFPASETDFKKKIT